MDKIQNAPVRENPELLDLIIGEIQKGLIKGLPWLDNAFGRAERLVRMNAAGKKIYTPNVYAGKKNDYREIFPSDDLGNFCFAWVDDPQTINWEHNITTGFKTPFSLIFWFDFRRIFDAANNRDKEKVKKQIFDVLNGGIWIKHGYYRFDKMYELAENIYRDFTIDEIDNCFLMAPYGGLRLDGELFINETCNAY